MPVVSGNVGENCPLTVTTTLEEESEVIIWFNEAWGIKEGLTFSWETTAGEKGVFDFSEVEEDESKSYYFEKFDEITRGVFGDTLYDGVKVTIPVTKAAEGITFYAENGNAVMDQILIKHYTGKEQKYYMPERGNGYGPLIMYGPYAVDYYMFAGYQEESRTLVFEADGTITCENEITDLDYFDNESLKEYVKYWHDWSEETGTPIMVNEFEILGGLPSEIRAAVLDSLLTEFDKYQIPWALFAVNYDWSPKLKAYTTAWIPIDATDGYERRDDYYYDTAALEIIKKHSN